MTKRTTPNSPGALRDEESPRERHLQESNQSRSEGRAQNESRSPGREAVNLQRSIEEEYDMGERRPSGRKGEMTNSDEIY